MQRCNYPNCDGAVVCKGAREEEDANAVVERYECEFGHTNHETVMLA